MSRIRIPTKEDAPAEAQAILEAIQRRLGWVPNIFLLAALSPGSLTGMTALTNALSRALDAKTRERLAIALAQTNDCEYCLAAHTYIGAGKAKISPEEIALNRKGSSGDSKADAAVRFAVRIAQTNGKVSDEELRAVRSGGYGDADIVDIVSIVADNVYHNMLNNVAQTDIDFPAVEALAG